MTSNILKVLYYIGVGALGLALCGVIYGKKGGPEKTPLVRELAPYAKKRVTTPGSLLSSSDPDLAIAKAQNRASGRSPAFDADATREVDFVKLTNEFLTRSELRTEEEKLKEFFPDGKGVNQSIRLTLLLASRGIDKADIFSEVQLSNRVQAEIFAHGESAVVSLNAGLGNFPKEMIRERQTVIRLLSNIATGQPELRNEVKASLLAEAGRATSTSQSALIIVSLLRVSPTKEWFHEVNHAYNRLYPGSNLSEIAAMNVVAL